MTEQSLRRWRVESNKEGPILVRQVKLRRTVVFFQMKHLLSNILCAKTSHIYYLCSSVLGEGNSTPLQYSCLENPWTEEPGGLRSMTSLRVGHDWAISLLLFIFTHWRRKWQPAPVFLPGESQGRQSLVGCRLWGRTESDMTEVT